jgi:putative transposase
MVLFPPKYEGSLLTTSDDQSRACAHDAPHQPNSIAKVMQALGRRYVPYINAMCQCIGTLWEGRYRASLVDADRYLLACYRYIELNPVCTGMVQHPVAYPWSSYRWHACGQHDPVITDHTLYRALGGTVQPRHTAYQVLCQHPIDAGLLQEICATLYIETMRHKHGGKEDS